VATNTYKIYKCTNNVNGKVYIGYTRKSLEKRIIEHKSNSKKGSHYLLHKAIQKYGIDAFHWEIIFESKDKNYLLEEMESYFIKEYNSYFENDCGYNMTYGGQGGMTDRTHTEETKNKLKFARNKRQIEPMLGKTHSDESKNKMSLARQNNPDRFIQASIAGKISAEKRKNNVEYKLKQSEKMKEVWASRKALGT
jgi:group I intron endonuclease